VISRRRYPDPESNSPVTTIRVTLRRCSQVPPSPCDPEMFSQFFSTFGSDTNCKKLALRGDEPPSNLDAAERRLNLPRRTCTITDDNGDTIFVNEVRPKPTSSGHDYALLPNRNTGRFRIPASHRLPPASLSLFMRRLRLQQQPPSHIYEEAQVTKYDTDSTLYC
jgi:hypothetical protein